MKSGWYRLFIWLSHFFGEWVFRAAAWCIASGYFILFPARVSVSMRFYRALYPAGGFLHRLWCAWKQYHNFTGLFLDRLYLLEGREFSFIHEGWNNIEEALDKGVGGVVLMSHLGNWEIAAHLLQRQGKQNSGMKLLLYLGRKHREQIEATQKEGLIRKGIEVVTVEEEGGSPFDILEGIKFLKTGGLVSLTGDRRWREDQRTVTVQFLGHEAFLPETPFLFALLSGAPLFIFFAFHRGHRTYHFQAMPPQYVRAQGRNDRKEAIRQAAQAYAACLEETVRRHPFEWYHFEPFIGRKL